MITWYDRFKGELVKELPGQVISGRYIAKNVGVLNGHTKLQQGDYLLNDGTGKFCVDAQIGSFIHNDKSEQLATESDIIESAILTYQEAIDLEKDNSFLISNKLLARFELTKFEELLIGVLKKGHLQEIARRPRMELIYEEHLVPVSRAKKIASSANAHLASHSECWQTKTLTGVIPKNILALESEDHLNIYENRVYVKLLENIGQYLIRRILEVKKLEEIFEQAESFQNAESIYFELRESIFTLWGEGFSDEESDQDAGNAAEFGITTLDILTKMLKKVRTLQHSGLYLTLTHNIHVPLKLNMTNVLSHDQHYRHIARLWDSWLDTQQANNLDSEQIFNRNNKLTIAYSQYCSDLVKRTLNELGFNELTPNYFGRNGSQTIHFGVTTCSEIILKTPEQSLCFVPCFSNYLTSSDIEVVENSQRVLLSLCHVKEVDQNYLYTSPTNFYSLEQLAALIMKWLVNQTYQTIGFTVSKTPTLLMQVINRIATNGYWKIENNSVTIIEPCLAIKPKLLEFKKEHIRDISISHAVDVIIEAAEKLEDLLFCPICGAKSDEDQWITRDDNCFAIRNSSCNHNWEVSRQADGNRILKVVPRKVLDNDILNDFERSGRYSFLVKI